MTRVDWIVGTGCYRRSANFRADQSQLAVNTSIDGPALAFDWPSVQIGIELYEAGPTGLTVFASLGRCWRRSTHEGALDRQARPVGKPSLHWK